jgi:hypothetical protein
MGCRAPQTLQPERGLVARRRSPSPRRSRMSGRRPCRSSPCPRPLSAVRASGVQRPVRSGRPVSTRPVSKRPVRSGRPANARPVSAASASALSAPRWVLERRWCGGAAHVRAHRVRRVAVGPRAVCRLPESGLAGKGMACVAGRSVDGSPGRRFGCAPAAAPRSPRELVQREDAGRWVGSTIGTGAHKSSLRRPGGAGVTPDHRAETGRR